MNVEIIVWWLVVGVIVDISTMLYLTKVDRTRWTSWAKERNIPLDKIFLTAGVSLLSTIKETPWWAHVMLVIFPPSALLVADF